MSSQETAKPATNGVDGPAPVGEGASVSEVARKYAASAVKMVNAVGEEVRTIGDEGVSTSVQAQGHTRLERARLTRRLPVQDDLRLLRIRTRRHELIITPGEQSSQILLSLTSSADRSRTSTRHFR